jgi:hypothetical protein
MSAKSEEHKFDKLGPIKTLEFTNCVSQLRRFWALLPHKELWFRGEGQYYSETLLRPELYRPVSGRGLLPVWKLLEIENELYEDFQRNAVDLSAERHEGEDWDWDSYFLMQHHNGPTRLVDWSDGSLIALHFALRNKRTDTGCACVYVLESYRFAEKLKSLPDAKQAEKDWKDFCGRHPSYGQKEHAWEDIYLPLDSEDAKEISIPRPPLVLEFPHITRRIAAQRSRFVVFGTDPDFLRQELLGIDPSIRLIEIAEDACEEIRHELRDTGVIESVIYPDLDGLGREIRQTWDYRRSKETG